MARGEGGTDGDKNAGLVIGSVLGTFALAAFLVVIYVSHEDEPVERPSLALDDTHISMRLCPAAPMLTAQQARSAIDTELRGRGYVSAGEWVDDQEIGVASGAALDGACGLIVAHARTGSHFQGTQVGGDELRPCRDDAVAIATCGADVEFLGTGVTSLRAYVMPGVSDAPEVPTPAAETLSPTHRLLQGEAEHLLGRLRLVPGPRVYVDTVGAAGVLNLPVPAEGCAHYAVSIAGAGLISPSPEFGDTVLFARTLCVGDSPIVINAGGRTSATLAVRRFESAPGVGVASRIAAQISDADIVTDMEDLDP